jgi:O-antigen/teichoic acid export membrane protein
MQIRSPCHGAVARRKRHEPEAVLKPPCHPEGGSATEGSTSPVSRFFAPLRFAQNDTTRALSRRIGLVMRRLLAIGTPQGFMRKSAIVVSGQAVGLGVAVLASPVLSRLYGPRDFGLLAIFVTLIGVVSTIATLRYENAIPLPEDDLLAQSLATLAKWSVLLTATLLACAAAFFGDALDRTIFRSQDAPFSWLLTVAVAMFAACEIHNAQLIRGGRFSELAKIRVVFALSCLATQLAVPLVWKSGPIGLLLGQIGGYTGELVYVWATAGRRPSERKHFDLRSLRRVAAEYRMYPLFDVLSSLLRIMAVNGQALLIAWLYGPVAAGFLLLAQRLLATPLSALSFSVSRVYYSEATKLTREAPGELRHLFLSTMVRLTLLTTPLLVAACIAAPGTFTFIFGERWYTAGLYCSILCPLTLFRMLAFVIAPTLDVVNRQGTRLLRELICAACMTSGVLAARWLEWSETTAVVASTVLGSSGYLVAIAITWRALAAHHQRHTAPIALPQLAKAA